MRRPGAWSSGATSASCWTRSRSARSATAWPRWSRRSWYDQPGRAQVRPGLRPGRRARRRRPRRRGGGHPGRGGAGRGRPVRAARRLLARRGGAVRGRGVRPHDRVLAARLLFRCADRCAYRAAGDRARSGLPGQNRGRRRVRRPQLSLYFRKFLENTDMATLEIRDLHVNVEEANGAQREILRGVDLDVNAGETHAIMGPNGSGKSTLAYAIAGHPKYHVTAGTVTLDGEDVLAMSVDARARAGLFLAMQYPVEVPGVSVSNFLRTAVTAVQGEAPKLRDFMKNMRKAMADLSIDPAFAERNLNEGFSGGEKKRHEVLQLELLNPKIAVLDETDSGLDIDALKVVSEGINRFRAGQGHGVLLITHYTRILRYVQPDYVHVFVGGRIVRSGGQELAEELETNGYEKFIKEAAAPAAAGASS